MTEAGTSPTDVLSRLADRFDEDGLPYAVGGALALGAWGVPRTTSDVDVSVFVSEAELDSLLDGVERAGAMVERAEAHRTVARTVGRLHGIEALALMAVAASCTSPLAVRHDGGSGGENIDVNMAANAFVQVSVGRDVPRAQLCGLRRDGSVTCVGENDFGQASPPPDSFIQISAGGKFTCGLRADGSVICWGSNSQGPLNPPDGARFTQISAGWGHVCGLGTEGSASCWGGNFDGQANPPTGTFTQVSAGVNFSCGLQADGSITCWGDNAYQEAIPPVGSFTWISSGIEHSCALRRDGSAACWGGNSLNQSDPPADAFTEISEGSTTTCGLRADGSTACWGYQGAPDPTASPSGWKIASPAGPFTHISLGDTLACGVLRDGSITCWGNPLTLEP